MARHLHLSLAPPLTTLLFLLFHFPFPSAALSPCNTTCGPLPIRYPFGTGPGCGSPRFHPFVTCDPSSNTLLLTTHAGAYPITSISYSASTITISPPSMSTCASMNPSTPNLGLDWPGPFQLGDSLFVLLHCPPSLLIGTTPAVCDPTKSNICTLIHTCPTIASLGLPLFAPTSTCCVYAPANLGPRNDELDLQGLRCAAYTSVVSLGRDAPMDPRTWEYGVVLRYGETGVEEGDGVPRKACDLCERSGGVCGYAPPRDLFVCVCGNGVNTTGDCTGQDKTAEEYWSSINAGASASARPSINLLPFLAPCLVSLALQIWHLITQMWSTW